MKSGENWSSCFRAEDVLRLHPSCLMMQNCLNRRLNVKSGENWSSCFRAEDVLRLRYFIHVCSPGVRTDNIGGQSFDSNYGKRICYFDHTL